ncbi:MAG: NAD(P)/FAD-dependent oxidoreductase [Chloroflexota bacterium]|jgi:NADH dehydrogenase
MLTPLRRDFLLGSLAGLLGGVIFAWALESQDMMVDHAGLLGLKSVGVGLIAHFLISAILGAGFAGIFRFQTESFAATLSTGILFGLLWWIAGPLTLSPFLTGQLPTWSAFEAAHAFPFLIGYLLFGAVIGISFYILRWLSIRYQWFPIVAAPRPDIPKRVVILGGGFAGVAAAQRLEKLTVGRNNPVSIDRTLISHSNYLLFTPMLAEVAGSSLEAQHISAPVRASCPHTRFQRATVEAIDTEKQDVYVISGPNMAAEVLPYDHLVLALGAVPKYFDLPGMAEHSFSLKSLEDATRLRNHVISLLERADVENDPVERQRQLTFVVAGGGFAGAEIVAELHDLSFNVLRYYPRVDPSELSFILIHSRERILPELSPGLADYAQDKLQARGIKFLLQTRVSGATASAVLLQDGRKIPTYTIVWTAGNQPNPLLRTLPCEHNRRGAAITDETLQVQGLANVWAIGDCAQIPDVYNKGQACPSTAQHALREGKVAAENIIAVLRGEKPKPFKYKAIGLLVALGHRTGAAELMGRHFSGLLAWFMWRSVYLFKLPGLEKKVRVLLDWTLDLFFSRDIVLTVDTTMLTQQPEENQDGSA